MRYAYSNPWVGYVSRSYQQIKLDLLNRLRIKAPEITDHSESNILIIIVGMFAGIAEMLNLYIDSMAREAFIQTCRKFSSGVLLVKLLDYRIKSAIPATADVTITIVDSSNNPSVTTLPYTIPAFTEFLTSNGIKFINLVDVVIPAGRYGAVIPVVQINSVVTNQNIGTSSGLEHEAFALPASYAHDTISVKVGGVRWERSNTLGLHGPDDTIFIVEIGANGSPYVVFGDGVYGKIPPAASAIEADYYTTLGFSGRVDAYTILSSNPTLTLPGAAGTVTKIVNTEASSGGLDIEDLDRIRISAPLSIRTLDRAVTEQDFEDIARLAPGVSLAHVDYQCSKQFDIYITPEGGGIASSALLTSTSNFIEPRRVIGRFPTIKVAGETYINISANITAHFRVDPGLCLLDCQNALLDYGDTYNQNINRAIRYSDIVGRLEELSKVDFLTITRLTAIPYARPMGTNTRQLQWSRETKTTSVSKNTWTIKYRLGIMGFDIYKNSGWVATRGYGVPYEDTDVKFIILPGPYQNNDQWQFTSYPANRDIQLDDFTVPRVKLTDLNLVVTEQFNPEI